MRKTLAASAIGAMLVLGGPTLAANAAPSDSASPVATATATATDTATATASSTEQVNTTKTVTEHDKTGLWGLLGLLGLAGLIPRKRHEEVRHVEHTRPTAPATRETIAPATNTEARRVDHVDNPIRTTGVDRDANDVRVTTDDTLRNTDPNRRNI